MSETALTPFRAQGLNTIKSVDIDLVPYSSYRRDMEDCARAQNRLRVAEDGLAWKIGLGAGLPWVSALVFAGWLTMPSIFGPFLLICALFSLLFASPVSQFIAVTVSQGRPRFERLREEVSLTARRWEATEALERLTGLGQRTIELRNEIQSFNADVMTVNATDCAPGVINLIEDRRSKLVARIGDFRANMLNLLPAPEAEPERMLLPERSAS